MYFGINFLNVNSISFSLIPEQPCLFFKKEIEFQSYVNSIFVLFLCHTICKILKKEKNYLVCKRFCIVNDPKRFIASTRINIL